MRALTRSFLCAAFLLASLAASAQQPTGLAAVPDKVFIVAERANLTAFGLFSLVNFDTVAIRVLTLTFLGNNPSLRFECGDLPLVLEPSQLTQVRVVYTPNGDTTYITEILLAVGDNVITGERDTVAIPIEASIGPFVPPDTILLQSRRSIGLLPNTIRYQLILESNLDDDIGFAEATFQYKADELYLGDYTVLSDSTDGVWQYTGIRIVPDNKRSSGDTIADFHFTILHGTNSGGDTNSVLDLIRMEWFAKFTGNRIYTVTIVDDGVVSDVDEDNTHAGARISLDVFPNPAHARATITLAKTQVSLARTHDLHRLALYSSVGAELMDLTQHVRSAEDGVSFTLDVSALPPGMYFLRLFDGHASVVRPFVVK